MQVLINYGQSLPYAKVYHREDWDVYYFDIFGKMFGLLSPLASQDTTLSLKNTPEQNEEWRELYPDDIIPGFHLNKKHWNTIAIANETITEELLCQLIKISYSLVCQNLKKEQKQLIAKVTEDE
ncbi:MmcQ/YjbR family DNA-binding protein [Vagococcus zengguangii]|uniref:MmcQ/YjbR family DNA-binding protein n=2 Tax=Vagococcus zengguangii TaxID=2571750 RepID=A0A4D7CVQ2_9ENTE|nr:MmcQ/YjbR family DNA-binding protein [Vagococcus zengguangii]TLG81440.1 MmcQ/YjbR family DNA-binding protein [Vagococcus zengguangii]